jgi:probable phosphoglycerate mutase
MTISATTVFLVRHAVTDWNVEGRWQCLDDRPINDLGRLQAESVAREIASEHARQAFDALYSSPLIRALQTAGPISSATGLAIQQSPFLRELDCGRLSGRSYEDARSMHPEFFRKLDENWMDEAYPGGETHRNYWQKAVGPALRMLIERHAGGRVVAVTHGGFIRAASMMVMGMPVKRAARGMAVDNCAYFQLELEGIDECGTAAGRALRLNITAHLRRDGLSR